jgi:hypothetical protein
LERKFNQIAHSCILAGILGLANPFLPCYQIKPDYAKAIRGIAGTAWHALLTVFAAWIHNPEYSGEPIGSSSRKIDGLG